MIELMQNETFQSVLLCVLYVVMAFIVLHDWSAGKSQHKFVLGNYYAEQGGVYCGMTTLFNRGMHHVFVGPEVAVPTDWFSAESWTKHLVIRGTIADFKLPSQAQLQLAYATVPHLFRSGLYWSADKFGGRDGCAWALDFEEGSLDFWGMKSLIYARAFRTVKVK